MRRVGLLRTLVFGLIAAAYIASFAAPPMPPIHGDGHYTYLWARSMAFDGDIDLHNDYKVCGDPWALAGRSHGVMIHNQWSPGPGLFWVPFLALGRLVIPQTTKDPIIDQACRGPIAKMGMFGSIVAGLLALWLSYRMTRRHLSEGAALGATLLVAFASPLPYYTALLPSYSHAATAFAVALALERWDATRGSLTARRWILVGACVGLAMFMRSQNVVIALAPFAEWIAATRAALGRRDGSAVGRMIALGLLFVVAVTVVFFPQMYIWHQTFGAWFAMPQGPHYMRWALPNLDGVFFATANGLLFWNPILYLSLIGLIALPFGRKTRVLGAGLLLAFVATAYVNSCVWDFWGGYGFSNRRFCEMTLPFTIGAAWTLERAWKWFTRRPSRIAVTWVSVLTLCFGAWNWAEMWGVAHLTLVSHHEDQAPVFWKTTFGILVDGVYDAVGNPLNWPASIPFAMHYHVHPKTYDVMRGMAVFFERYDTMAPRPGDDVANFAETKRFPMLVDGFGPEPRRVDRLDAGIMTADDARMLIPIFIDDVGAVEFKWRATDAHAPRKLFLSWNGHALGPWNVTDAWRVERVEIPRGVIRNGVNVLRWHVDGGPVAFASMKALQAIPERAPLRPETKTAPLNHPAPLHIREKAARLPVAR